MTYWFEITKYKFLGIDKIYVIFEIICEGLKFDIQVVCEPWVI